MKKSLQARADKLGTLGCKVDVTHLSRKGKVSHFTSTSLSEALQACTPEQQLALQQEVQKGPEKLLQLLRVCPDVESMPGDIPMSAKHTSLRLLYAVAAFSWTVSMCNVHLWWQLFVQNTLVN